MVNIGKSDDEERDRRGSSQAAGSTSGRKPGNQSPGRSLTRTPRSDSPFPASASSSSSKPRPAWAATRPPARHQDRRQAGREVPHRQGRQGRHPRLTRIRSEHARAAAFGSRPFLFRLRVLRLELHAELLHETEYVDFFSFLDDLSILHAAPVERAGIRRRSPSPACPDMRPYSCPSRPAWKRPHRLQRLALPGSQRASGKPSKLARIMAMTSSVPMVLGFADGK